MQLRQPLVRGSFLTRLNRFAIAVRLDSGEAVIAHLPNSGRLQEVLIPGNEFWLTYHPKPYRRTAYDAVLSRDGDVLVCVDARLPPYLLAEALRSGGLKTFGVVEAMEREVWHGGCRLDLRLKTSEGIWWVETKSVTLVIGGVALFPDAPTLRGREHLRALMALCQRGEKAAVVFIVQRPDAHLFAPHERADPLFAETLREAMEVGVKVIAYRCQVSRRDITVTDHIPFRLHPPNF